MHAEIFMQSTVPTPSCLPSPRCFFAPDQRSQCLLLLKRRCLSKPSGIGSAHSCHQLILGGTAVQAGGLGSTGRGRVMEVDPTEVHQRVPLFVGSKKEVEYLESFLSK